MLSLGLAIVYGLKVNYHVAVVAMVNHTALAILDGKNVTEEESGEVSVISFVLY